MIKTIINIIATLFSLIQSENAAYAKFGKSKKIGKSSVTIYRFKS
jgi:hypothetical protein